MNVLCSTWKEKYTEPFPGLQKEEKKEVFSGSQAKESQVKTNNSLVAFLQGVKERFP
jgi:hypothetical protein